MQFLYLSSELKIQTQTVVLKRQREQRLTALDSLLTPAHRQDQALQRRVARQSKWVLCSEISAVQKIAGQYLQNLPGDFCSVVSCACCSHTSAHKPEHSICFKEA